MRKNTCFLILESGDIFSGISCGADPLSVSDLHSETAVLQLYETPGIGEVVFNTGMTGYYEILTDPSYTGQLVMMTYSHIGNYGVDPSWSETAEEKGIERPMIKASGLIVRDMYTGPVPEGREQLAAVLARAGIPAISGIDTRRLTLLLREKGSQTGIIVTSDSGNATLTPGEIEKCKASLSAIPHMEGMNLVGSVGTMESYICAPGGKADKGKSVALIDYGVKENIIREMMKRGIHVTVFPSSLRDTSALLNGSCSGVLLSNGPGDPAVLSGEIEFIRQLIGKIPLCGICLGHQLLGIAMGGKSYKMKFGHHGINHPVRYKKDGRVFVTSQNHGFALDGESLPDDVEVTFTNANDGSIEGIDHRKLAVSAVQFHPEAAPGPFDSSWIFDHFLRRMNAGT